MRLSVFYRVSIVLTVLWCVLPLLIAAYAVKIQNYTILMAVSGVRSFCFSYTLAVIALAFGSASWLVQPMLQFSDWLSLVVFCVLVIRWSCDLDTHLTRDLCMGIFLIILAVIIDFLAVSPFLMGILD